MGKPQLIRNVAIIGHLHHGKTLLSDMLVEATHETQRKIDNSFRHAKYTDSRVDEIERKISLKAAPFQILLQDSIGKSFAYNFMDTPGHPDFLDEVCASLRLSDNVILVVDVLEGCTDYTEKLIQKVIKSNKQLLVFVNKIDRLVLELKVPPDDAYHIIKRCLDNLNICIQKFKKQYPNKSFAEKTDSYLSPLHGNVVFGSTRFSLCFSLQSFACMYQERQARIERLKLAAERKGMKHGAAARDKSQLDAEKFAKFLWGNIFYDIETRKFKRAHQNQETPRSFVHFVMEPIYKLFTKTLSCDKDEIARILKEEFAVDTRQIKKQDYEIDINPLLTMVFRKAFPNSSQALTDTMTKKFMTAAEGTKDLVQDFYVNSDESEASNKLKEQLQQCSPKGPLCINVLKQYYNERDGSFECLGRIISGTIKQGQRVRVLGENFTTYEQEDMVLTTAKALHLVMEGGRYKVSVDQLSAGNWLLMSGIDQNITKTATIFSAEQPLDSIDIFRTIDFGTEAVIKLACEPLNPSELPKMLDGLRTAVKSYPICQTKVEESGEHILIGTGELYMDSVMHDIRTVFNRDFEIKISEPFVSIAETVADSSSVKCQCETPNKKNTLSMMAQPLDKGLQEDI